ncbi:VOC family protein [Demequina sp. NBRC 110055]|uniref:VOC family protein n=1 Tax=Demequina sp. NBRC 110055 TaxID=1570344 RepID=UPI0009FDD4C0|nr:VOC family protein [Demequina sp. NBRC 110055]
MLDHSTASSAFSTDSVAKAATFYLDTLGLDGEEFDAGGPMLRLHLPGGGTTLIYEKEDHTPASHTVLMFTVGDVAATVRQLAERDVPLERLDWCDEDGIARDPDGDMPDMAWFKDPAGNWIHVMGPMT